MYTRYKKFYESKKKFPNLKKIEIDEFQVLIGRDSESNDYLSTIMADDDDLWMHVKGHPGSHVVIKTKDRVVPSETRQKVAEITAQHSKCKDQSSVEIVCCKAKFVTKPKGLNPGQVKVDYNNSEFLVVRN